MSTSTEERRKNKSSSVQISRRFQRGDESEDSDPDELNGDDVADAFLALGASLVPVFAPKFLSQQLANSGGKKHSVDVRTEGGKLHVPLDGDELELSKRKIKSENRKPPKLPPLRSQFFASERTRIEELIRQVERRKAEEEKERRQKLKEQRTLSTRERQLRQYHSQRYEGEERVSGHSAPSEAGSSAMWSSIGGSVRFPLPPSGGGGADATSSSPQLAFDSSYWDRFGACSGGDKMPGRAEAVPPSLEEASLSSLALATEPVDRVSASTSYGQPLPICGPNYKRTSQSDSGDGLYSLQQPAEGSNRDLILALAEQVRELQVLVQAKKARERAEREWCQLQAVSEEASSSPVDRKTRDQ